LKYQWIRYLSTENVPDEFWSRLFAKLFRKIKALENFFCDDDDWELIPAQLRFVPMYLRDSHQKPLLPDWPNKDFGEAYISEKYDPVIDHPILRKLGVTDLSMNEFITRLAHDLSLKRRFSFWKSKSNEDPWHEKIASVLLQAIEKQPGHKARIDQIKLVPLINSNRKWVPPRNASIFFPTCRGIDIPTDLELNLVAPQRLRWPAVMELFRQLGVSECAPERVFPDIKRACVSSNWTVASAVEHLKFVFWNHDRLLVQHNPVMIFSARNIKYWPHYDRSYINSAANWFYNPGSKELYSAAVVIGQPLPEVLKSSMEFLHPLYFEAFNNIERRNDKTGPEWLEHYVQVKTIPQLQRRRDLTKVSFEVAYIARNNPQKLLGVLKANWQQARGSSVWQDDFRSLNVQVPILNSYNNLQLRNTYLPLPRLRSIVKRLGLKSNFGFIQELRDITDEDVGEWRFLNRFGVGMEEDMNFWINALKNARLALKMDVKVTSEIYTHIQRLCTTAEHESLLR
jgi:hypothetical protein